MWQLVESSPFEGFKIYSFVVLEVAKYSESRIRAEYSAISWSKVLYMAANEVSAMNECLMWAIHITS